MTTGPQRDFVGYGAAPPDFTWPNGARLAVDLMINYDHIADFWRETFPA